MGAAQPDDESPGKKRKKDEHGRARTNKDSTDSEDTAMHKNARSFLIGGRPRSAARPLAGGLTGFASPVLLAAATGDFVLAWLDGDRLRALHLGAELSNFAQWSC